MPTVHRGAGGQSSDGDVSVIAPSDLSVPEREFWQLYAPDAVAAGTLTPRTISSWRLLCEVATRKQRTAVLLEKAEQLTEQDGKTYIDSLVELSRVYVQLATRTETLMGRFGLAPLGRAIEGRRGARKAPNPFEKLAVDK